MLDAQVLKDSLMFCFPLQIIKITLASSYCRNMQLVQALDILKEIRGYETECAELLFHNGGADNIKQA